MNQDCLKLTAYFGERDRTRGELLADELMNVYGSNRLRASILLRGTEGFGRLQHMHTNRLLSLSEDLPAVAIAVDERPTIEAMLGLVIQIQDRGLITLERARMLTGHIQPTALPEKSDEETKLTIYLGRRQRVGRTPAHLAICDLLHRRGIAGATVLLGVDGTRAGRRHRARFVARNAEVPMMILAVGAGARMADLLPEIGGLLEEPMMTLERVKICKRDGQLLNSPHEPSATDEHGLAVWQKLMIYSSHRAMHGNCPIHMAIVRRLREADAAGATVINGIWGFHGDHAPHGDRFFQIVRRIPVCTIVIDTPARMARSFEIIDEITSEHGLVTSELVPAVQAMSETERRGGLHLAAPGT